MSATATAITATIKTAAMTIMVFCLVLNFFLTFSAIYFSENVLFA